MNQRKTIGIIGGISPMSTAVYYSRMAMEFNGMIGGLNYPRMVISSVNMADIHDAQVKRNFREPLRIFINAITDMPSADFILVASNTMHRVVRALKTIIDRDILDIRDVVADAGLHAGFHKVLLLGSQYTMEGSFYRNYLQEKGLEIVVPNEKDRCALNSLIYEQLCRGEVNDEGNALVQDIVSRNAQKTGVEAVVLACTEFSLLKQEFCIPSFDSTELHVKAAVQKALSL